MQRWDIINALIKKNNYTSYAECGYYKGWSFDRVECLSKTAIDPNPSKTIEQENTPYGGNFIIPGRTHEWGYKLTSDDFFAKFSEDLKCDIWFIDGLHESSQVDKDIQNALKHLNPGGTIVMHDCNPSTEEMTLGGTVNGEWTGDVYKSFIKFRASHNNETYVIDTDYGVGIIKDNPQQYNHGYILLDSNSLTWNRFEKDRKQVLNLISPEEFLEREKINQEENV